MEFPPFYSVHFLGYISAGIFTCGENGENGENGMKSQKQPFLITFYSENSWFFNDGYFFEGENG